MLHHSIQEKDNVDLRTQLEDIEQKLQDKDKNIESLLKDLESYKGEDHCLANQPH